MRAQYGYRIRKYPLQRKTHCRECNRVITRDEVRYEAELVFKDHYNPYWTNRSTYRVFEISCIVCEQCMKKLTQPQYGMRLVDENDPDM